MSLNDVVEPIRRVLTIFFVIDVSGNMAGSKIAALNCAIDEVVPAIKRISMENTDVQIKIAVLKFGNSAEWITKNGPEEAETFIWQHLDAEGITNFGDACESLNEKISTRAFMAEATYSFAPVIFLFSGSVPTDNWQNELTKLKQNKWFKMALKVAVAIGDDADKDMLAKFTGSPERVITAHDSATLIKMIKFVEVEIDECVCNDNSEESRQHELNAEKIFSLSISIIDDGWDDNINAEVLSISPSRNYIICKSEMDKKMLIVKCPNNSDVLYKSDVSFFSEIVNISKIIWHESESYFDVYYDFPDKDQIKFLTQHICRYETKNFGHFEIEKNDESVVEIETLAEPPDRDDEW